MKTLFYAVWLLTVVTNVALSVLLFVRGLYVKFSWLTLSCVLSVVLDAFFAYLRAYYPHLHMPYRNAIFFLFLFFDGMIVIEGVKWGKRVLVTPVELLIAWEIVNLLLQKANFPWSVYYSENGRRIYNLFLLITWIMAFRKEPPYELD